MYSIEEMLYEFDLRADRLASKTTIGLPVPAKVAILNAAQLKIIQQLADPVKGNGQPGFQEENKRTNELQVLESVDVRLKVALASAEEQLFEAPMDKLDPIPYKVTRQVAFGHTEQCGEFRLTVIETQSDDLELLRRNSNTRPSLSFRRTLLRTASNKLFLYADRFKISRVQIDYVRYPRKMSIAGYENFDGSLSAGVNCELPLSVQDMIVDEAVVNIKSYSSDPGVQAALMTRQRTG